jgi:hypothetical protein
VSAGGGGGGFGPPGAAFQTGVTSGDGQVTITYLTPATPTSTPTATHPAGQVSAKITGCLAQGGDVYACALQVRLGMPPAVNTVFSVDIGSGAFANPSDGDRPQVTASQGCDVPPLPSPYLTTGETLHALPGEHQHRRLPGRGRGDVQGGGRRHGWGDDHAGGDGAGVQHGPSELRAAGSARHADRGAPGSDANPDAPGGQVTVHHGATSCAATGARNQRLAATASL